MKSLFGNRVLNLIFKLPIESEYSFDTLYRIKIAIIPFIE
jgi:hypothetical protein